MPSSVGRIKLCADPAIAHFRPPAGSVSPWLLAPAYFLPCGIPAAASERQGYRDEPQHAYRAWLRDDR